MADLKAIKDLVVCSFYGRTPDPTKYSADDVRETVKSALKELAPDYYSFQKNKWDVY